MSMGRNLVGPMPSLGELVRRAGVSAPALVPQPVIVNLGAITPFVGDPQRSQAAQKAIANIEAVRQVAIQGGWKFSAPSSIAEWRRRYVAANYSDYLDAIKNRNSIISGFERDAKRINATDPHAFPVDRAEIYQLLVHIYNRSLHTADFQGYVNYVGAVHENYVACLNRIPPPALADDTRHQHTYITGSAGSGKTELLKALVHHDLVHNHAAVIIDPTGNFARAVAMWPEFEGGGADRLVYINPKLKAGMVPALNPLDARRLEKDDRSILAGQLTDVLAQVVGKGEWTTQTETVASNCLQVAVNTKGATLRHLRLALVETEKKKTDLPPMVDHIIRLGKLHHIPEVRDFFTYEFTSSQYATSKGSLRAKLSYMLRNELFASVTGLPSRIHLEELVDARKVIVFDLGAWGDNAAAGAFGRMVIAQLAAIGMRRSTRYGEPQTPMHIFVDEADLFVGPAVLNILSKLRQHGVHLTLAQQTVGYGFDGADKHQLLNNTAIKFTAGDGQREMLTVMHAPPDATQGLRQGQFVGRWGRDGDVFRLDVRSDLLGNTRSMSPAAWEKVVQHQLQHYYARLEEVSDEEEAGSLRVSEKAPSPKPRRRL